MLQPTWPLLWHLRPREARLWRAVPGLSWDYLQKCAKNFGIGPDCPRWETDRVCWDHMQDVELTQMLQSFKTSGVATVIGAHWVFKFFVLLFLSLSITTNSTRDMELQPNIVHYASIHMSHSQIRTCLFCASWLSSNNTDSVRLACDHMASLQVATVNCKHNVRNKKSSILIQSTFWNVFNNVTVL